MFGARDLALFLPDKAGDVHSLRHTELNEEEVFQPLQPKKDDSKKVVRYFSGKAPAWLDNSTSISSNSISSTIGIKEGGNKEVIVDRRLRRLAKTESPPPAERGRRRIYEAEVIADDDENIKDHIDQVKAEVNDYIDASLGEEEDEDEEDVMARRHRLRNRTTHAQSIESHMSSSSAANAQVKYEKESSEESEYETDTDDSSEDDSAQIMKPVFVPRNHRETLKEQDKQQEKQLEIDKRNTVRLQERKQQTREMVADSIRRNEDAAMAASLSLDNDEGRPDDTDDPDDDAEEFENWKLREINRLKRDSEQREASALEKADLERRRNMTEDERLEEDKKLGKFDEKEKTKWKFMQKYYHKGVFYMDEDTLGKDKDDVRKRSFNEPTLEDKFNFEALPQVLQVKKFGMRGRTKYTHLADQDTTNFIKPLLQKDKIKDTYMTKGAGTGNIETAGRLHKKSKLDS